MDQDFTNNEEEKIILSETAGSVLKAFIILYPNDILAPLAAFRSEDSVTQSLLENTRDGLKSVLTAGTLPYLLMSHSVQQRRFDSFHTAERIRSLKLVEIGEEPSERQKEEAFRIATEKLRDFARSEAGLEEFRAQIIFGLNQHLTSLDVEEAASELLIQASISTWSVFESAVRTFIIGWINAEPARAYPVLASADLKTFFGKQAVEIDLIGAHGFDLRSSMGDILFRDRRLDNLPIIRSVLQSLFCDESIRYALDHDMWLLNQRRHLFVHRRGIVDAEYLKKTSDDAPVGRRLPLTSDDVEHYILAVQAAVIAIAQAAKSALNAK